MMFVKTNVFVLSTALMLAAQVIASPILDETKPVSNETRASDAEIPSEVKGEFEESIQEDDSEKPLVEDCTLKALRMIVTNQDRTLSQDCKDIIYMLTENAGKLKEPKMAEEVSLRQELNELAEKSAKYDALSKQIQSAEDLLAEKRRSKVDDLDAYESDDAKNSPLLGLRKDLLREYNAERRLTKQAPENFWNGNFVDESILDQELEPDVGLRDDIADEDYLVIPLRFLRKNKKLSPKPITREFYQEARPLVATKQTVKKNPYDKEMVRWLLRTMQSLEGQQNEELARSDNNPNEPPEATRKYDTGEEKSVVKKDFKGGDAPKVDFRVKNKKDDMKESMELDREIVSRIENDIDRLGKDLRQLRMVRSR